jgi:hypothetical protein
LAKKTATLHRHALFVGGSLADASNGGHASNEVVNFRLAPALDAARAKASSTVIQARNILSISMTMPFLSFGSPI